MAATFFDHPTGLRHDCRRGCWLTEHMVNWDAIGDSLGGYAPSDVDGIFERNGRFLFFEFKTGGALLTTANVLLQRNLLAINETLPGTFTVVNVLAGERRFMTPSWPIHIEARDSVRGKPVLDTTYFNEAAATQALRDFCASWWERTNAR